MTPLRQRMTEDMQVRNFSPLTIKLYLNAVIKFSLFFHKSPALLGPEEVRTYQVYLIHKKKASCSAFNIAVSALQFLFTVSLEKDWAFKKIPYGQRPKTWRALSFSATTPSTRTPFTSSA
jgi:integrase/recombinase XerD